jgi:predicted ester cyclase
MIDHTAMAGQAHGAEGIKQIVRELHAALVGLRFITEDVIAEGDQVVIRWTIRGTLTQPLWGWPATGRLLELRGLTMVRIVDGRVVERWSFSKRLEH